MATLRLGLIAPKAPPDHISKEFAGLDPQVHAERPSGCRSEEGDGVKRSEKRSRSAQGHGRAKRGRLRHPRFAVCGLRPGVQLQLDWSIKTPSAPDAVSVRLAVSCSALHFEPQPLAHGAPRTELSGHLHCIAWQLGGSRDPWILQQLHPCPSMLALDLSTLRDSPISHSPVFIWLSLERASRSILLGPE